MHFRLECLEETEVTELRKEHDALRRSGCNCCAFIAAWASSTAMPTKATEPTAITLQAHALRGARRSTTLAACAAASPATNSTLDATRPYNHIDRHKESGDYMTYSFSIDQFPGLSGQQAYDAIMSMYANKNMTIRYVQLVHILSLES